MAKDRGKEDYEYEYEYGYEYEYEYVYEYECEYEYERIRMVFKIYETHVTNTESYVSYRVMSLIKRGHYTRKEAFPRRSHPPLYLKRD